MIDGVFMLLLGIYACLVGFKVVNVSKKSGPEQDKWYATWGTKFKYLGPIIVVCALIRICAVYFH